MVFENATKRKKQKNKHGKFKTMKSHCVWLCLCCCACRRDVCVVYACDSTTASAVKGKKALGD